jgi:hypothetical protein
VTRLELAQAFIHRIRNIHKRDYALDYLRWWTEGGREPERPDGLGYMGAQAVRMQIEAILPRGCEADAEHPGRPENQPS